jgi:tRNA A37 methylthiotransferase MiaB
VHHVSGYEVMQNSSGVFDWVIDVCERRKDWLSGEDASTPLSPQEGKIEVHLSQDYITQANHSPFKEAFRTPFRELLEQLNAIPSLDRIRFTSSNPHDMTRDILDAHFDLEKCCHYLHFALQSGDNDLLKKMNRKHSYDDFKSQVDYLRSRDPLFGISTDIIVGFPGETEEQFENTVKAFRECEFDYAYIARYSPRKQTYAAKMS